MYSYGMTDELNSVKKGRYHHGDLRAALLDAAEALLGERGVDGFSLRECARRAGVSPAAPAHHFGDTRGLLTALATRAFAALTDALAAAPVTNQPVADLHALGAAYVGFALARPALFDLMWRRALLSGDDLAFIAAADAAFDPLAQAVARVTGGAPDRADVMAAWSMVHGYARLTLDGAVPPETRPPLADVVRRLTL